MLLRLPFRPFFLCPVITRCFLGGEFLEEYSKSGRRVRPSGLHGHKRWMEFRAKPEWVGGQRSFQLWAETASTWGPTAGCG